METEEAKGMKRSGENRQRHGQSEAANAPELQPTQSDRIKEV